MFECISYILPVPELSGILEPELKQENEKFERTYTVTLKHRELLSVVCGDEAVGGEMSIMLCWAAALLCLQGCCEKVCGRCESSVWKECRHCYPQEPLQNCCGWLLSPPCTGGTLLDGNTGLCSTGRDLLIPGETPRWSSYCCSCHLEGTYWCPGERKRHWAEHWPGSAHRYMLRSLQQ